MQLTIVESICFVIPVILSYYYFLNPRSFDSSYLLYGRMSGISEPNFTSLSLIISLCGAFGIYWLKGTQRARMIAIAIVFMCIVGIVLTGSRAGFIGMMTSLGLFLIMNKKFVYASLAGATAIVMIGYNSLWSFLTNLLPIQRLQSIFTAYDPVMALSTERSFTEFAFYQVQSGNWFNSGAPQQLSEWAGSIMMPVPHNSLLDIGLLFGKACFYFYSFLIVLLLVVNIKLLITKLRQNDYKKTNILVSSIYFLSLLPMYMSLSAGLQMNFILWIVLGAYPLLHPVQKVYAKRKL